MAGETWIDLLDPSEERIRAHLPPDVSEHVVAQLLRGAPRPRLQALGDHVLGAFLVAVAVPAEDDVYYQEIDFFLDRGLLLTVRRTPPGRRPYDPAPVREASREGDSPSLLLFRLTDHVADRYLDIVDDLDSEIDELEDHLDEWEPPRVRDRLRRLRHQLLHVRRTLAPMREAVRSIQEGRVELPGNDDLRARFGTVHDILLRAHDGIDLSRELLVSLADYHQARIANDVNQVVKRLTVVASLILVPTFIVGLYGQNFRDMPEFSWGIWGYVWSWGLIVGSTLAQLAFFRWKRWL